MKLTLTLAERFLILRRRMHLTQAQLGKLLGVHRRTIWYVEREKGIGKGTNIRPQVLTRFEILEQRHLKTGKRNHLQVP